MRLPEILRVNDSSMRDFKKVGGGLLVQDLNCRLFPETELKVVTEKQPTEKEMETMLFAWRVVKHTKSNGIVLAKGNRTVGIGRWADEPYHGFGARDQICRRKRGRFGHGIGRIFPV